MKDEFILPPSYFILVSRQWLDYGFRSHHSGGTAPGLHRSSLSPGAANGSGQKLQRETKSVKASRLLGKED
jgi:hypothetical protein